MKVFLILLLCIFSVSSMIYSSPPKVTYNYNGYPLYYSLFMSLETGIGASDYLRIIWPEAIFNTAKTQIVANLVSFSNNLQVATTTCVNENVVSNLVLHVTFGYAMQPNTWYEVQIYPSKNPTTVPISYLIQVLALSDYNSGFIIYDSNLAFGFIDINAALSSTGTLGIICNSSSTQQYVPSSIYSFDIYITPGVSSSNGGNFSLSIYYDSGAGAHATGTSINDFTFMGLCQSAATNGGSAAVLLFCSISSDLSTITFALSSVTSGTAIRISTSISNPLYNSVRGIKGYWTQFISGKVLENGLQLSALTVNKLSINTVSPRILLFWGIQSIYNDGVVSNLPLFKAASSTPNIMPMNSFNVGFSFSSTSPINGQYFLTMTIGAQAVLEGSIAHNLPSYNGVPVYCYYDTTNLWIACKNVGAFINTAYRYFISGKAYFNSLTASTITFGAVSITPIVYSASGTKILSPVLYNSLAGVTMSVQVSQQFLDLTGYHNTGSYKIGNAQVVSYADDLTLSSTSNAIQGFLQGTNSTVGVVPGLGGSQQLLFLLKTTTAQISSGAATSFTINVMFNNQVISFETSAANRGLDFTGYQNSASLWSISYSPCYYNNIVVCEKYNNATPNFNVKTLVNTTSTMNFYGMYTFQCGSVYTSPSASGCSSNCASQCTMFTGYGTSDKGSSVMAMRQVIFPSGYQSSIYADATLLDFLFTFSQGGSIASYGLINAYTMTGSVMSNIKAAYVNYYDNSATGAYNKGVKIPMMLRIGGGILPAESNNATAIGLFFDDFIDASTFYTTTGSSFAIGCSTGSCNYFPNKGISNTRNDNWHTNRRIIIYNLPPIQNQFNILVPVTPDSSNRNPPKILTIVFFTQNYSIADATNLLQTQSVYRLYGPTVTGSLSGTINTINGLSRVTGGPDLQFSTNSGTYTSSGSFSMALNTTNMYSNSLNNTFTYGNSDSSNTFGTYFGGGYTITSFYYNIFASSTLQFDSPPSNTAATCTIFGYVYNEIQNIGANPHKNGQYIYTAFCPIDSSFSLSSSVSNINFLNPQYPSVFTNNFPLQSVLTIAYSNQNGFLRAYRVENSPIATLVRTCTTAKLQTYNPSSSGKQRATFIFTVPSITLSSSGYAGYSSFRVIINIPSSTVSGSGLSILTYCDVSLPYLSCTVPTGGSGSIVIQLNYIGTGSTTITYFELNLYATVSGAFAAAAAYTVTVYLPQYNSAVSNYYTPFGNSYSYLTTYCTCQSSFTVGITGYGTAMNFNTLTYSSNTQGARSSFSFLFGANSFRDTFFTSSTYVFDFGFTTTPSSTYSSRSNLRCLIYQGSNSTSMTLSTNWRYLSFSSFTSVTLTPKTEIATPANILYQMNCYGSGVPTSGNQSPMTLKWVDNTVSVQTANPISFILANYPSGYSKTATLSITYKRFATAGCKSLYSFAVSTNIALTQNSRLYFDFHMSFSSMLDNEGNVQCYIRTASAIVDSQAQYTYCTFTTKWQLMVWNNANRASGSTFYVDIFNIDQPKAADIGGLQYIGLTVDDDSTYSNGVKAYVEILDTDNSMAISSTTPSNIRILTSSLSTNYIISSQTLTITFDTIVTSIFTSGNYLFVLLPAAYAQWITRAQTMTTTYPTNSSLQYCELNVTGTTVNRATACVFISQRILQITVSSITNNLFSLKLMNLMSPAAVPTGKFNQYRFKLFVADSISNTKTQVTYYSFTDYTQYFSLTTNPSLISLSWNYWGISVSDSLVTLSSLANQVITVYIGYYSNVIELRQSIFPSNFKSTMVLTLTSHASDFTCLAGSMTVNLGTANAYFRLAGASSITPGLYNLGFTKTGDSNNYYTNIPPLTLVVQSQACALSTNALTYTLPIGGSTLPIVINAMACIPTQYINITVSFNSLQFSVNNDLSSLQLKSNSIDGQLYLVFTHTAGVLTAGSTVTATFNIAGPNSGYYSQIPAVQLTLVDPTTFQTFPTGTSLSPPTLLANTATFSMQCSQSSLIYWGLGVYPSILNSQAVDFQARITSGSNGLTTNFTQSNDYYRQVYGIRQGTTMQVLSKKLYNLQSNTNYLFKYFCVNQLGHISDSQSINFTSLNYGAYLMKVEITLRGAIKYSQYNDLACSLARNFIIPQTRIMTQAMSYCGSSIYTFYPFDNSTILNQPDSNGWYIYGFYILPDYTQASDSTNANIRNQLSLNSFTTTIITSTNDYINLPSLVQMQTYDIQIYTTPTMTVSAPLSGLTSIVITASITNMNGFIVMGIMAGAFNASTMTIPSNINIKQGKFSSNQNLLQVHMIHVAQNYLATFQFTGLASNTLYTFYYFSTVEDPQLTSLNSPVKTVSAQTLEMLIIDINWQHFLSLSLVILLFLQ